MSDLQKIIKSLVQQCNIEAISAKDLTAELSKLYTSVESLENRNSQLSRSYDAMSADLTAARERLSNFEKTYVLPVDKINADRKALEEEKFKFNIEKEYVKREMQIYQEMLRSLTTVAMKTRSVSNCNGSYNEYEQHYFDKPGLPGTPFQERK